MKEQPRISIIMPLGRISPWFDKAVRSALQQSHAVPVHLIANALTAEENQQLEELRGTNVRLIVHTFEERLPMAANWNRALQVADEPWVVVLHDDDLLEADFIENMLPVMDQSPALGIYMSRERMIDCNDNFHHSESAAMHVESHVLNRHEMECWAFTNRICASGFVMDRTRAIALGGYNESLAYTPDWDLYFQIAVHHGASISNFFGARYRFDTRSGQLSSKFVQTAQCVDLYHEQQMKNATLLKIDCDETKERSMRALMSYARFITSHYIGQMNPEGVKKVAQVVAEGCLLKAPRAVRSIAALKWSTPMLAQFLYLLFSIRCIIRAKQS